MPPANAPLLEVVDLVKRFGALTAVGGVNLRIEAGSCLGLLGPNGAGKTTTVEMIEGLTPPTSGRILYRGEPLGPRFKAEAGIQFQHTALQDFLTVAETLALFRSFYDAGMALPELHRLCALEEFLDRDARRVSGGQRQRLLLAMALVNDPAIVFLDEPTTGLDPQARRAFWDLVRDIKARGKTVLLTTHYMEEAYTLCDRIAIMDHGRIIAEGSPEALLAEHFREVVVQLPRVDFTTDPADFPLPVLEAGANVEILTADVEVTLDALRARGVRLARVQIRPRTLEDLFLSLTGRELRA